MSGYVTFDPATGALVGSFDQAVQAEHVDCYFVLLEPLAEHWTTYRMNAERTGLELAPPATPALTQQDYVQVVQDHLDAAARERNYDDIVSACSYAGAPNPFQAEGVAYTQWRGACWSYCYALLADVEGGERQPPTIAQLLAELPALALAPVVD